MPTFYEILDIPPSAAAEEIKAAYRIQVQLHHPDRLAQSNPSVRAYAEERLKKINEAYATLNDPERRAKYDAQQNRERARPAEVDEYADQPEPWDYWRPRGGGPRRSRTASRQVYEDFAREAEDQRAETRARERAQRAEQEQREAQERAQEAARQAYPRLRIDEEAAVLALAPEIHVSLVRIPAGEFQMGSDPERDPQAGRDDQPQHHVHVSAFFMARGLVTNAQFQVFAQATRHAPGGQAWQIPFGLDICPVVDVNWDEAYAFCQWLSKTTGRAFRLPSEAEWEKAARGPDGRLYPWGDEWDAARLNAEGGPGAPTPAGQYSPAGDSPYGLADMSGNVWEWCADWYDPRAYGRRGRGVTRDPRGPAEGQGFVIRGGAFDSPARQARCAHRNWHYPDRRRANLGFRLCLGA